MSLQFVLGNSGSGKSHYLYETVIAESRLHPERNYMVIVPEQFTMQTQKDLVMLHPDRGIMNIDVLSFRRLAHRIFEEVGADRRSILTETGKNLMLRKVALEQQEHLQILGGKMNRPGYVSEVKSMLSELMQYEVTDFELQELLSSTTDRPLLHAKLEDIRLLYREFLAYQRHRFLKPEELLDVLCSVAGDSKLLKNSTIALDGFTGFTPSQMNVLEKLFELCPKVSIALTIDAKESLFGEFEEYELFALSKKTIRAVSEAAKRAGTQQEEPVLLGQSGLPRFQKGGALEHLEQQIFRKQRNVFCKEQSELSLHTASMPAMEVHFAARTISKLVREDGYRYQDIAVITGSLSAYNNYVKKIFPMYQVPVFLDETRHILLNPCLEFVRGALLLVQKDFSYETVFRWLRTGMAGLTSEEIDRLENYVLAVDVRGKKRWSREWTYRPNYLKEEQMDEINQSRSRAMVFLEPFADKMKGNEKTLKDLAEGLYELLVNCEVQQQLKDRELELEEEGAREEAREYSQMYRILVELLDEMVDLMGDEPVSLQEFSEILDAGFSEAKVGIIPPGIDQVQVGDIQRSRLNHVKVLFFLGINDGWVPAREENCGIVSDSEREMMRQAGVELAPTVRENSYIQRFYLYQNLTKPTDRLYLSWCASNGDGSKMRPSYLISVIRKLFPLLVLQTEADAGSHIHQVTTKENGLLYLTQGFEKLRMGQCEPAWRELYRRYKKDENYSGRIDALLHAAFPKGAENRLTYTTSRELYGEVMYNSVTRLEQFASCAFAHFAAYGLKLGERELYGVKPADLGIIFHHAMELFSRKIQSGSRDWSDYSQEEQEALMNQCVDEISGEYGSGILHGSARDEYTICRLKRILGRTAWALHRQICAGSFRPAGIEVSFSDIGSLEAVNVQLEGSGQLHLRGRIDRIDTSETDDTVYVKVVDYKSGAAKFDPVSLYYGLQLQLVVYLNAALELEQKLHPDKEVVPAGIFYHHLDDPLLDKEGSTTALELEDRLLKKLRPEGILNADSQILFQLDHGLGSDSQVIPAGLKKDGSLKAATKAATTEEFARVSHFVSDKLTKMGSEILAGRIQAKPFTDRVKSACDYCAYLEVCGYDHKIPGQCERQIAALSSEEAWAAILAAGQSEEK